MGVVLIDAFQVCLKSLPNFLGENSATFCLIFVAKIQQSFVFSAQNPVGVQNSGRNPTFHLKFIIAHQTLFSPRFRRENTVIGMPHFHGENPTEFHVWCAMAHK